MVQHSSSSTAFPHVIPCLYTKSRSIRVREIVTPSHFGLKLSYLIACISYLFGIGLHFLFILS